MAPSKATWLTSVFVGVALLAGNGCAALFAALAASDAAHADGDEAVAYQSEARERRRAYVELQGDDLSAEMREAILGGYVREGMTKRDVIASVGHPQDIDELDDGDYGDVWGVRLNSYGEPDIILDGYPDLLWEYTDDPQLAHRNWESLWVTFQAVQEQPELVEWLKANPKAFIEDGIEFPEPVYRVVEVRWEYED